MAVENGSHSDKGQGDGEIQNEGKALLSGTRSIFYKYDLEKTNFGKSFAKENTKTSVTVLNNLQ